ncbi:hypothetical protein L917_05262 [Phytophthora nicotianae]|uniref:Uncharacterized protein n=2 Tax=Phytophthora nicotianae TaxID=4792 RepID=V9FJQ7_PHYNI|nr:hypothetical protein F443_05567 [Phytophthora nicotianae P1569]ETL97462.1 hypothetical protein L917_05262 [Phytophthora nicotianae]
MSRYIFRHSSHCTALNIQAYLPESKNAFVFVELLENEYRL